MTETQAVLIRAAQWLENNPALWGWGQCYDHLTGSRCAAGALMLADVRSDHAHSNVPKKGSDAGAALAVLAKHLRPTAKFKDDFDALATVTNWNDESPDLTAADVAATMRAASRS